MRRNAMIMLLFATMAAPAVAQTAPPMSAPSATSPAPLPLQSAYISDPQVVLWGYFPPPVAGAAAPMRPAMPDGAIGGWLPDADPAVQAMVADPQISLYLSLMLSVDEGGRVTACSLSQRNARPVTLPALINGLCERVTARARFTPAINEVGTRLAERYELTMSFIRAGRRANDPVQPLVMVREPSPAPFPPGREEQWPPRSAAPSPPYSRLPLAQGGAAAHPADGAPWAGVEVRQDQSGRTTQRIVQSSKDAEFDQRALRVAASADPQWPDSVVQARRWAMIHFVGVDGRPAAILPVGASPTYPNITPEQRAAVQSAVVAEWTGADQEAMARLRVNLNIDDAGGVTRCRILASSGSDDGDVAGCRAMREVARFEPHRDIFGWPHPSFVYNWAFVPVAQ